MSNFTAKIVAMLDTSKIPSEIAKIEKQTVTLSNFKLDTSGLPSDIQASLDKHKFKISLDGIKTTGIDSKMKSSGNSAAKSFSSSLLKTINSSISSGGIEASIAKVTAQYEKLGTTGHSKLSQIKNDIETLKSLQGQLNTASDDNSMVSTYEEFNNVLKRVKSSLETVSAESKTFASALQMQNLDNDIASWMDKNREAAQKYGEELNELRSKLKSLANAGSPVTTSDFNAIKEGFDVLKSNSASRGITTNPWSSMFKNTFAGISKYVTTYDMIQYGIRGLKDMYKNVVNIDSAMVELRKVTNESEEAYSSFLGGTNEKAQKIGTTITGLVSSTADFARLGYSFKESQQLAEVANIYAVVGDEIESVDAATESVISTMKAFNIPAEDAIKIVDKYNEVGNNYAISSGGIGEAMKRSASSLSAANNTIDESIALITAANSVVQNPESVGKWLCRR